MEVFEYGRMEIDHLQKQDRKLGLAIERIGKIERRVIPDLFAALVNSIVAQQISAKAADTVWRRLLEHCGEITPRTISAVDVERIRQCGLSMRKAGYIKGIGEAVAQGVLDLSELPGLPDDDVITRLSALPGIGVWTAEMLLIFSLQRPNVVSWGDLGIQRGMMRLYGTKKLDRAIFERYRKRYAPYGSVASLYLWRVAAER
jgi:DNA-3-methyladenine glycosylase II